MPELPDLTAYREAIGRNPADEPIPRTDLLPPDPAEAPAEPAAKPGFFRR